MFLVGSNTMNPTSDRLRLFIQPLSILFRDLYIQTADKYNTTPLEQRDSGFDLYCDPDSGKRIGHNTVLMGQGCKAVAMDRNGRFHGYWLAPRSSISKTPWRLANSLGLIDPTYRGEIKAALDYHNITSSNNSYLFNIERDYHPSTGNRLVQLAAPNLLPWEEIIVVDSLPGEPTVRGEGGFGSSNEVG
jgi:dUTP pyrophosphatase